MLVMHELTTNSFFIKVKFGQAYYCLCYVNRMKVVTVSEADSFVLELSYHSAIYLFHPNRPGFVTLNKILSSRLLSNKKRMGSQKPDLGRLCIVRM